MLITSTPDTQVILLAAILATVIITLWFKLTRSARFPPGPKRLPFVGNVFDMPKSNQHVTFDRWAKQYGEMTFLKLWSTPVLILNTRAAAHELLEKKGAIYADRPMFTMAGELCGWDKKLASARYSERTKDMRKLLHGAIGNHRVDNFTNIWEQASARYINKLLTQPEAFIAHNRWFAGRVSLAIGYGYMAKEKEDPYISNADRVQVEFGKAAKAATWMVDFWPFLKHLPTWLPGMQFKQMAATWKKSGEDLTYKPYQAAVNAATTGTASPCVVSSTLEGKSSDWTAHDEDILMWAVNGIYGGGADTSVSALSTFFLAMVMFPSVQQTAQAEIDKCLSTSATGSAETRYTHFDDRDSLPYINALIKETLRWGVVVGNGVAHRLMEDDIHEGYLIPEGTIVIPNIRRMLHDPEVYPNPMAFDPTRFIGEKQQYDPRQTVFGFGRRVCPGTAVAENNLFIAMSRILATLDILPINGEVYRHDYPDHQGLVSFPKPFKCRITPRSEASRKVIEQEAQFALIA